MDFKQVNTVQIIHRVSRNHSFWNESGNFTIFNIRKIHGMYRPYEANFTVLLYVKYTLYFQVVFRLSVF